MDKIRRQEMLRLIESELHMLQSEANVTDANKTTNEKTEKTVQWVPPTEAFEKNYGTSGLLDSKEQLEIISYNILSLELGGDDYYRNLDGSVQRIDLETRKQALNTKIQKWIEAGKVICLQEVTYSFINETANPVLHTVLNANQYAIYSHFYSYMPNKQNRTLKGTCRLGLATLIPRKHYDIKNNGLLRPWENPEIPLNTLRFKEEQESYMKELANDLDFISKQKKMLDTPEKDEFVKAIHNKWHLDPTVTTTPLICAGLAGKRKTIQNALNKVMAEFKNSTPGFGDRSVIILKLQDANDNEILIANVHFPCQYRYPKIMASIAIKTKLYILDWMTKTSNQLVPLLLCGDFNSSPEEEAGSAYHCLTGSTEYISSTINTSLVSAHDFHKAVTNEKWIDCLRDVNNDGCTNYGFTKSNYEECKKEFHVVLDSILPLFSMYADALFNSNDIEQIKTLNEDYFQAMGILSTDTEKIEEMTERIDAAIQTAIKHKLKFIKPKSLLLDHMFLRDLESTLNIVSAFCPQTWFTEGIARGKPLPNMDSNQPSDHLAINLTLAFKYQHTYRSFSDSAPSKSEW